MLVWNKLDDERRVWEIQTKEKWQEYIEVRCLQDTLSQLEDEGGNLLESELKALARFETEESSATKF